MSTKPLSEQLPSVRSLALGGLVIGGLTLVGLGLLELFGGLDYFVKIVNEAGAAAPLLFIVLKALTYVVAPLSGAPLKITAGALFGFWPATLYVLVGDGLGGSLNYWLARIFGRPVVAKFTGSKELDKIDKLKTRVDSVKALVFARIVLAGVYDFVSYAAGLLKIPFQRFLLITIFAGIPPVMLAVGLGNLYVKNPLFTLGFYGLALMVAFIGITLWQHLNNRNRSKTALKSDDLSVE